MPEMMMMKAMPIPTLKPIMAPLLRLECELRARLCETWTATEGEGDVCRKDVVFNAIVVVVV